MEQSKKKNKIGQVLGAQHLFLSPIDVCWFQGGELVRKQRHKVILLGCLVAASLQLGVEHTSQPTDHLSHKKVQRASLQWPAEKCS